MHRPAHPRIGIGVAWPIALIEAAENDQIRILQTGFQRSPNMKSRMTAIAGPDDPSRHHCREQGRIDRRVDRVGGGGGMQGFIDELGERFTRLTHPKTAIV